MKEQGMFIVFEGGDGCGKTTQLKLLADYLKCEGYKVFTTKEPGGTELGEFLRKKYLLNPDFKKTPALELFLFEAIRSEFTEKIVKPKLNENYIVLSDRYHYATTAYQGYGGGIDLKGIEFCNKLACQGIEPDLTFIIDISASKGLGAVTTDEFGKKDWFEQKGSEYHERVNQGYREIAKAEPKRVKIVPYIENDIEEMHHQILKHVKELLKIE